MEQYGIDVSVFQGNINWETVKAAGKNFVMIRAGWANSDGSITPDTKYQVNMNGALSAGIPAGVYLYSYLTEPVFAQTAAKNLLKMVENTSLLYPVVLDMEDRLYINLPREQNTAVAQAFLSEIQNGNYYSMLYTYASFANNYLNMQELRAYDFWLAEYSTKPSYKGEYGIWQYTGNGRCDGIPTVCSLDIAYQDYPTIIQQAGLNRPLHPCIPAEEVKKLQQTIADLQNQLQTVTSEKNTYLKQITEIRNILK